MVAIVYTASYIFCLQQNELQHAKVSLNMFENINLKLACETVKLSCSFHLSEGTYICKHQRDFIFCIYVSPIALRKAKIVCSFGLSECNRVQQYFCMLHLRSFSYQ